MTKLMWIDNEMPKNEVMKNLECHKFASTAQNVVTNASPCHTFKDSWKRNQYDELQKKKYRLHLSSNASKTFWNFHKKWKKQFKPESISPNGPSKDHTNSLLKWAPKTEKDCYNPDLHRLLWIWTLFISSCRKNFFKSSMSLIDEPELFSCIRR